MSEQSTATTQFDRMLEGPVRRHIHGITAPAVKKPRMTFNNGRNCVFVVGTNHPTIFKLLRVFTGCDTSIAVFPIGHNTPSQWRRLPDVGFSLEQFLMAFVNKYFLLWKEQHAHEFDVVMYPYTDWREKFAYLHVEHCAVHVSTPTYPF